MEPQDEKSPVEPRNIYLEKRISDLGRAIGDHTMRGFVTGVYAKDVSDWCMELMDRIAEYQDVIWDEEDGTGTKIVGAPPIVRR